jgi:tRNA(fMet)-specific endonuclease VapC
MMQIFLDTSAYSAFLRGHHIIKQSIQRAEMIWINPIVLGELRAGFIRGRKQKNEDLLIQFLSSPRVQLASVDEDTAERYAVIVNELWRAGNPIPTNDLWIAASVMQYGLILLTTDAHFLKVSQIIVRHFSAKST